MGKRSEQKLIFLSGLPASGKSTWSMEYMKDHPNTKRINKDSLRFMLDYGAWSGKNEGYVMHVRDILIVDALDNDYDVIVDDTNLNPSHLVGMKTLTGMKNVKLETKFFDVPLDECIKNDLKRHRSVGEAVIRQMYNKYLRQGNKPFVNGYQDSTKAHAIICDLDGTLALHNGRNPYDASTCEQDLINEPVKNILMDYKGGIVLFVSGRDSKYVEQTLRFLEKSGFPGYRNNLYMRTTGDTRKDVVIKKELYEIYIAKEYYIDFVLDDRNQTVNGWRKLGLTCLQVADGDF